VPFGLFETEKKEVFDMAADFLMDAYRKFEWNPDM